MSYRAALIITATAAADAFLTLMHFNCRFHRSLSAVHRHGGAHADVRQPRGDGEK